MGTPGLIPFACVQGGYDRLDPLALRCYPYVALLLERQGCLHVVERPEMPLARSVRVANPERACRGVYDGPPVLVGAHRHPGVLPGVLPVLPQPLI
jgi:hypothetical protein